MLDDETEFHRRLEQAGHQLSIEPRATSRHVNISRLGSYAREKYYGGRAFGANRAAQGDWTIVSAIIDKNLGKINHTLWTLE